MHTGKGQIVSHTNNIICIFTSCAALLKYYFIKPIIRTEDLFSVCVSVSFPCTPTCPFSCPAFGSCSLVHDGTIWPNWIHQHKSLVLVIVDSARSRDFAVMKSDLDCLVSCQRAIVEEQPDRICSIVADVVLACVQLLQHSLSFYLLLC